MLALLDNLIGWQISKVVGRRHCVSDVLFILLIEMRLNLYFLCLHYENKHRLVLLLKMTEAITSLQSVVATLFRLTSKGGDDEEQLPQCDFLV